jgi:hypothetical protein
MGAAPQAMVVIAEIAPSAASPVMYVRVFMSFLLCRLSRLDPGADGPHDCLANFRAKCANALSNQDELGMRVIPAPVSNFSMTDVQR